MFAQSFIGEVLADSEDQARQRITDQWGTEPGFQILALEPGTLDDDEEQPDLPFVVN